MPRPTTGLFAHQSRSRKLVSGAEDDHAAAKPGSKRATKTRIEIDRSPTRGLRLRVLALSAQRSAAVAVSDSQRIRALLPQIATGRLSRAAVRRVPQIG